jgi:hypothetical protein
MKGEGIEEEVGKENGKDIRIRRRHRTLRGTEQVGIVNGI